MVPSVDTVIDVIGVGAMALATASMVPQILLAHQRKSTQDLSSLWQGMFICGLVLESLYFWHYSLRVLFYPALIQLALMVYLVVLGLRFDGVLKGSLATVAEGGIGDSSQQAGPPQRRTSA